MWMEVIAIKSFFNNYELNRRIIVNYFEQSQTKN